MSTCLMHEEQQPRCKLEILFLTTTGYSLQPATCHLPPCTCHLQPAAWQVRPATDFTNLHAELFFASRIKWARAECTFGLSLREAQCRRSGRVVRKGRGCKCQWRVSCAARCQGEQEATASRHAQRCLSAFCSKCIADLHTSISPCMCGSVCVCLSVCVRLHMATGSWRHMKCIEFPFYSMHLEANLCYAWCRLG